MLGFAMLVVFFATIAIILITLIIRKLVINISESVRERKNPSCTGNAVICEKKYDDAANKYFLTFDTESGKKVTTEVSSWEYNMFEIGQKVVLKYRQNIALDIKLIDN